MPVHDFVAPSHFVLVAAHYVKYIKNFNQNGMEHELIDSVIDMDLMSIDAHGITYDYFNEVQLDPENEEHVNFFISKCQQGLAKTYTQRYQNSPIILERSNPKTVEELDRLMLEAIEAANKDDRETIKLKIKQILLYRK